METFENDDTSFEWEEDPHYFVFNDNKASGTTMKMHIKRLDLKNWIQIDKTYIGQMKVRKQLIETKQDQVYVSRFDNEVEEAKQELFEMVTEHLVKRFPYIFEQGYDVIYNKVLQTTISTRKDHTEDPLLRLGNMTQEDWIILQWDENKNAYVLTAGLLCFPMRWSLQEKFGNSLSVIHEPVTAFMEHLANKVNQLFVNLKPGKPVWRANWGIYHDLNGPLDLYAPPLDKSFIADYGPNTGSQILLRHEYQTLRKLPKTKCVVFSIRTYQRPLEEFQDFPLIYSQNLLQAIEDLDPEMARYKGAPSWKEATVTYLKSVIKQKEEMEKEKTACSKLYIRTSWKIWSTFFIGFVLTTGFMCMRRRNINM